MDWGMENRLSRLIKEDGRCFFMPIDHGYFQARRARWRGPGRPIKPLLPYYDALFVTRGVLRHCIEASLPKPIILRVSGGTSMVGEELADEAVTTSIEEIIRLNALGRGDIGVCGLEIREADPVESGEPGQFLRDVWNTGDGGDSCGKRAGEKGQPLLEPVLPYLRGVGCAGGQDLLVREL